MVKHAFRDGFLDKMAEMGVTPTQMNALLSTPEVRSSIHDAVVSLTKSSGGWEALVNGLGGLGELGMTGLAALALGPPLAGATLGYAFSPRTSDQDIESLKEIELLKEYQSAIDKLEADKAEKELESVTSL